MRTGYCTRRRTLALLGCLMLGLIAAPAAGARGLETILQDDAQLLHRPEPQLRRSLEELKLLGVDRLRLTAGWSVLTRSADDTARPGFDATDPLAYEQDRWRELDRAVVLAREYGFDVMIDIGFWAPRWASADGAGQRGRTEIDAEGFREFAVAVARRYSGSFLLPQPTAETLIRSADARFLDAGFGASNSDGPVGLHDILGLRLGGLATARASQRADDMLGSSVAAPTAPLPRVDMFTLWNEPNHPGFLRPQWVRVGRRFVPRSPHLYRHLVARTYPAVKEVRPDATVLVGATAATGSTNGTGSVPPLHFLRELACVDRRLRPLRRPACAGFQLVPGDGWSHHPYSMSTEPDARNRPNRPDSAPIGELPRLARTLDALADRGRIAPELRAIWITEYGYETNPPDRSERFTPGDQARFLPWAEYLASRVPSVRSFAQFLLRDLPPGAFRAGTSRKRAFGEWQSGLLFESGVPKLAAQTFRAGLFAQRRRGRRLRLFVRLRLGEGERTVVIERRPAGRRGWTPLATRGIGERTGTRQFTAGGQDAVLRFAAAPRGRAWRYRLRFGDGGQWRTAPSVRAVG